MKPDDHRPDRESGQPYDNVFVRKGSIAAFVAAARRYHAAASGSAEAVSAAADIAALLPAIAGLGLFDVFAVRSERVRALLKSFDPTLRV